MSDWETPAAPAAPADWDTPAAAPLQERDSNAPPNTGVPSKYNTGDASANIKLVEDTAWTKPVPYNYNAANAATREERDQAARDAQQAELLAALIQPGAPVDDTYTADVPLWAHAAKKYEWKEEYGDVGPKVPELEGQLFGGQFMQRVGDNFKQLTIGGEYKVTVESEEEVEPIARWEDAALHPVMLENVKMCKYLQPTAIQGYCVPAILSNHDLVAISQTGSGKTAAYLIPVLSKLMGKAKKLAAPRPGPDEDTFISGNRYRAEPLVLIIVPTRELATQVFDEARRLCYRSMLRPCVAYGGGPRREQLLELKKGCDVLIGTPGRLMDFMEDGALLSMSRVRYTIIDEADELVSPDWAEDMKKILTGADANQDADHRYMMFSATFPKGARALAKEHLADDHVRLRVGRIGQAHKNVGQKVIWVNEEQKQAALFDLLIAMPPGRTIVFVNNKRAADFLDDFLYNNGMPSTSIHSDRTQREREDSLRSFRSGKTPILVATGVSARGWDVYNVVHVINYDLPSNDHGGIQEYVHRIGRTARIGNPGQATSFYNDRNEDIRDDLIKILIESGQPLPDFFEEYRPQEGQELDFDDNSDEEVNGGDAAGVDDGWGPSEGGVAVNGAWGTTDANVNVGPGAVSNDDGW